ncbi:MAG: HNH endonuclease [Pseudomonadota bacterium]
MAIGKNWTVDEIEQAIALYIITPFGKLHQKNPDIVDLAKKLDRTPGSIALKLVNLASIDETLDRKGMANASKLDRQVWNSSFERLFSSASLLNDEATGIPTGFGETDQSEFSFDNNEGVDIFTIKSSRQGQQQFRKMISANYDHCCAITGISQPELLVAGHISPWASDKKNRLNPRNGILLNRLHDKAFEEGLMVISENGKIIYSDRLEGSSLTKLRDMEFDGYLRTPSKFKPDPALLRTHHEMHFANF